LPFDSANKGFEIFVNATLGHSQYLTFKKNLIYSSINVILRNSREKMTLYCTHIELAKRLSTWKTTVGRKDMFLPFLEI